MSFVDNQSQSPLRSDTEGKLRNQILSLLVTAFQNVFPRVIGTFTLAAAATTTVSQPAITANSLVQIVPTNASAGTLMGSAANVFWDSSANVPGASFTVKTADGSSAAGTETFAYFVVIPV